MQHKIQLWLFSVCRDEPLAIQMNKEEHPSIRTTVCHIMREKKKRNSKTLWICGQTTRDMIHTHSSQANGTWSWNAFYANFDVWQRKIVSLPPPPLFPSHAWLHRRQHNHTSHTSNKTFLLVAPTIHESIIFRFHMMLGSCIGLCYIFSIVSNGICNAKYIDERKKTNLHHKKEKK